MGSVNVLGLNEGSSTAVDIVAINSQINSKVSKNGDEMQGDLQTNGNKITGLPTNINQIEDSDAASYHVSNELLNNGLTNKVDNAGDEMVGNLFLRISNDNVRALGCKDLINQTGFSLLLGTYQNQIQYERQEAAPQPIKVLSSNGTMFLLNGSDYLRIGSADDPRIIAYKPIQLMMGIDDNVNTIYNTLDPVSDNDAATKQYVDKKVRKCKTGLVPFLAANSDSKSGYIVSASSEHSSAYSAYNAMKYGPGDWATLGITTNF